MMPMQRRGHRVVVLGAGYAGLGAAQRLARQVCRDGATVTVVNAAPRFVERPRLHQAAAGQRVTGPELAGPRAGTGAEPLLGRATAIEAATEPAEASPRLRVRCPRRQVLTGRAAVWYKELVLAGGLWVFRKPGPYLPRRRRPARAVARGRVLPAAAPVRAGDGGR